ncbi:MAG TPA: beta-galactosidase [Chloroflexota bacterium]|nr:beta-galactosidase [Chloroflexota bacterium]
MNQENLHGVVVPSAEGFPIVTGGANSVLNANPSFTGRPTRVLGVIIFLVAALLLVGACSPPTKAESPANRHATREADRLQRGNQAKTPVPERVATRQAARADNTPVARATRADSGPAKEATRLVQTLALTPTPPAEAVGTPSPGGTPLVSQSGPKIAHGTFAITQHNTPFQAETFSNPSIDGIVIRTFWQDVEPSPGQYNWNFIDGQVNAAAAHGKKVILIVLPGAFTPSWALDKVTTANFDSSYGFTQGQPLRLPLPWDQTYLQRWDAFVQVLGQRYDPNPTVVLIPVAGPTSVSAEMSLPNGTDALGTWQSVGYTPDKFETAWISTIKSYARAFPSTQLSIILYPGLPIPDPSASDKTRADITAEAVGQLGGKLAIQTSGLSARKEDHPRLGYQIVQQYAQQTTVGFEMGTSATEKPDRMGGPDPTTALRASIDYGLNAGARYLIIYEKDVTNPALQDTLRYAHTALQR